MGYLRARDPKGQEVMVATETISAVASANLGKNCVISLQGSPHFIPLDIPFEVVVNFMTGGDYLTYVDNAQSFKPSLILERQ